MSNAFLDSMKDLENQKLTENGAPALKSTKSSLLDLFGTIGALRYRSEDEIISNFIKAYYEDRLLAMKMLFYARDIRGGLGERDVPRIIYKYLAENHQEDMKVNFDLIAEYGRWDDFYVFVNTPLESDAFARMKSQFEEDLKNLKEGKSVSLLAKWLKSVNTSSLESKRLGLLTAKYFFPEVSDLNSRQAKYRKAVSKLRAKIELVESQMSSNSWGEIKYEAVPSKAAKAYRKAFARHDKERYDAFISDVDSGKAKINASTLYPYDLVREYSYRYGYLNHSSKLDETIEAQWKALPNYVTNNNKFLILADVSGSMSGLPMYVSVSLAIYFAERTTSAFKNSFLTFETNPRFVEIPDNSTLHDKIKVVESAPWGGSTNLKAAFERILEAAKKGNVKPEDMPEALVVITDMEINAFGCDNTTFTSAMRDRFHAAGYEMPTIVWWNVDARENTFHAEMSDNSVRFVSGCSASIFKSLCENMGTTPMDLMLLTLNSERYEKVKIA